MKAEFPSSELYLEKNNDKWSFSGYGNGYGNGNGNSYGNGASDYYSTRRRIHPKRRHHKKKKFRFETLEEIDSSVFGYLRWAKFTTHAVSHCYR